MHFSKTAVVEVPLSDVTKPLLVISRLFGMNPKSQWHKIYTVFILISEPLLFFWVWQYHCRNKLKNDHFQIFVRSLENLCRMISIFIILGSGLFDRKRFMIPIKEFANIDESLRRLGGSIDNRVTYRSEMFLFTCIGLMPLFFLFVDIGLYSPLAMDNESLIIVLMAYAINLIILIICAVTDCFFSSTLCIMRKRFKEINLIIRRNRKQAAYLEVNFVDVARVNTANDVLRDLKILRKLYYELWRIGNRLNRAYGLHLLVGATTSLALITSKLWEIHTMVICSGRSIFFVIAGSISWTLFCIVRMFLLAKACDATVTEAHVTSIVLQKLWVTEDHDSVTKGEIRDFLTQLQLEAQNFTACGFFNVDYTLFCSILGAACTYLVILIQMGDSNACTITSFANKTSPAESVDTF